MTTVVEGKAEKETESKEDETSEEMINESYKEIIDLFK